MNPYKTIPGHTYAMKVQADPPAYIWGQVIGHLNNGMTQFVIRSEVQSPENEALMAGFSAHGTEILVPDERLEVLDPPTGLRILNRWAVYTTGPNQHVVPMAEWPGHEMTAACDCKPAVEYHATGIIVVHNAQIHEHPYMDRGPFSKSAKTLLN